MKVRKYLMGMTPLEAREVLAERIRVLPVWPWVVAWAFLAIWFAWALRASSSWGPLAIFIVAVAPILVLWFYSSRKKGRVAREKMGELELKIRDDGEHRRYMEVDYNEAHGVLYERQKTNYEIRLWLFVGILGLVSLILGVLVGETGLSEWWGLAFVPGLLPFIILMLKDMSAQARAAKTELEKIDGIRID